MGAAGGPGLRPHPVDRVACNPSPVAAVRCSVVGSRGTGRTQRPADDCDGLKWACPIVSALVADAADLTRPVAGSTLVRHRRVPAPALAALALKCQSALDLPQWFGSRRFLFRIYTLLLLAAETGLRLSELISLDKDAVHLGTGAHVRRVGKRAKGTMQAANRARAGRPEGLAQGPGAPQRKRVVPGYIR